MIEPLADSVITRLRRRYPGYQEAAYLFVLSSLQFTIERLGEPRHITGRELALGCRDHAIERFGPMAKTVFEYWGIRTSADLGNIVFALVECGVLIAQEDDSPEDFEGVFEVDERFEAAYPWRAPERILD